MLDKNIVMTTKELADYIKVHEKTVIKQAQEGKLPGVKIGNQWRFHLNAIDEHLQRAIVKMPDDDLNTIIKTTEPIIPISRLTDDSLIALDVEAKDKDSVLQTIATIAKDARILSQLEDFLLLLHDREALLSTAIGDGVAVPHPRKPLSGMFSRPYIIIVRTKEPIEFDAPDHKKVRLFFALCATDEFIHLRTLAKVSKLLHEVGMREKLAAVKTKKELMQILLKFDRLRIFSLDNENADESKQ